MLGTWFYEHPYCTDRDMVSLFWQCTYCKSLWIEASAKCPKCLCWFVPLLGWFMDSSSFPPLSWAVFPFAADYLQAVCNWMNILLPKVKPWLYSNKGNIISVQVDMRPSCPGSACWLEHEGDILYHYSHYEPFWKSPSSDQSQVGVST